MSACLYGMLYLYGQEHSPEFPSLLANRESNGRILGQKVVELGTPTGCSRKIVHA